MDMEIKAVTMRGLFLLASLFASACIMAGNIKDAVFETAPGESWQLDWAWREKKVPLTAMMKPHLTAYDASGKVVYDRNVGKVQQRVFDPKDLNVQKWQVFATVLTEGETRKRATFTTVSHVFLPAATVKVTRSPSRSTRKYFTVRVKSPFSRLSKVQNEVKS